MSCLFAVTLYLIRNIVLGLMFGLRLGLRLRLRLGLRLGLRLRLRLGFFYNNIQYSIFRIPLEIRHWLICKFATLVHFKASILIHLIKDDF